MKNARFSDAQIMAILRQAKPASGDISFLSQFHWRVNTLSNWRHWIILTTTPKLRRSVRMPKIARRQSNNRRRSTHKRILTASQTY